MKIHQMPLLPLPHPVGSCCGDNLLTISYNPVTISFVSKGLGSQRAPPRGPSTSESSVHELSPLLSRLYIVNHSYADYCNNVMM